MEGGKRGDEAGASSSAGFSSAGAVSDQGRGTREKQKEMAEKLSAFCDGGEVEEEEDDKSNGVAAAAGGGFVPGPLVSLKEQIEKDKDDESLRRWKEKLLGCLEVESDLNGQMETEVKFHSIGIISDDFGEVITPLPVAENHINRVLFTLQEGSQYRLKLTFSVLHNIVSGLIYSNTVWKGGLQVDQSKGMLGTFAPNKEPYVHTLEEETTPSGLLARGLYAAKLKFEDDDRRCHMELQYSFEIKKGR